MVWSANRALAVDAATIGFPCGPISDTRLTAITVMPLNPDGVGGVLAFRFMRHLCLLAGMWSAAVSAGDFTALYSGVVEVPAATVDAPAQTLAASYVQVVRKVAADPDLEVPAGGAPSARLTQQFISEVLKPELGVGADVRPYHAVAHSFDPRRIDAQVLGLGRWPVGADRGLLRMAGVIEAGDGALEVSASPNFGWLINQALATHGLGPVQLHGQPLIDETVVASLDTGAIEVSVQLRITESGVDGRYRITGQGLDLNGQSAGSDLATWSEGLALTIARGVSPLLMPPQPVVQETVQLRVHGINGLEQWGQAQSALGRLRLADDLEPILVDGDGLVYQGRSPYGGVLLGQRLMLSVALRPRVEAMVPAPIGLIELELR